MNRLKWNAIHAHSKAWMNCDASKKNECRQCLTLTLFVFVEWKTKFMTHTHNWEISEIRINKSKNRRNIRLLTKKNSKQEIFPRRYKHMGIERHCKRHLYITYKGVWNIALYASICSNANWTNKRKKIVYFQMQLTTVGQKCWPVEHERTYQSNS